jgi:hypothetical protein
MKNDKAQRRKEAELLLAWIKFSPEMGPARLKPGVLPLKGKLGRSRVIKISADDVDFPDWKNHARYAAFAFGTEHSKERIKKAAAASHKQFFIDLGKCLEARPRLQSQLWDKRDLDIAEIVLQSLWEKLKAKEAVRLLEERGHQMTEERFRKHKSELLRGKSNFDGFKWLLRL